MRNIYKALSEVQANLKAPKSNRNTFGNYNYRSAEDILEAVKPLLKDNDLAMTLSDKVIQVGDKNYIEATVSIYDLLGDSEFPVSVTAFAREAEDKKGMDDAQITGAASSYARKYALNGMFNIDDTKDADSDEHHNETTKKAAAWKPDKNKPATDNQKSFISNLLTQHGYNGEEQKIYLVDAYGLNFSEDGSLIMSQADAEMVISDLDTKGGKNKVLDEFRGQPK